jgi:hypothetical protein
VAQLSHCCRSCAAQHFRQADDGIEDLQVSSRLPKQHLISPDFLKHKMAMAGELIGNGRKFST